MKSEGSTYRGTSLWWTPSLPPKRGRESEPEQQGCLGVLRIQAKHLCFAYNVLKFLQ